MTGLSQWVWWGTAVLLTTAGAGLLVWSLLWDWARGRLRCPRCWYRMEGTPIEVGADYRLCPECGRAAHSERALRRTRRRWRWALAAGVPLLAAYVCWVMPRAIRDGWSSVVPTTMLLLAPMDVVGASFDSTLGRLEPERGAITAALHEELERRVESRPLWGWQDALLGWRVRRCAASAGMARVPDAAAALHRRIDRATVEFAGGTITLEALAEAIESQTGIPCRFVPCTEDPGAPTEISAPVGRVSLLAALDEVERLWPTLSRQYLWTVDDSGIVIGEEGAIAALPDLLPVAVHDLSRGASWELERGFYSSCFGNPQAYERWLSDEFPSLEDAFVRFVSDVLWIEGGGSVGRHGRLGRWLLVRATPSMHARIDGLLRALNAGRPVAGEAPTPEDEALFDALSRVFLHYDERDPTMETSLRPVEDAGHRLNASREGDFREPLLVLGHGAGVLTAIDAMDLTAGRRWAPRAGLAGADWEGPALEWAAAGGGVEIARRSRIVVYDLAPVLIADDRRLLTLTQAESFFEPAREEKIGGISECLVRFVDERSWPEGGGSAPHWFIGARLLVAQSAPNHIRIRRLLRAMEAGEGAEIEGGAASARALRARRIRAPAMRIRLDDVQGLATEALGFEGYVDLAGAEERLYENRYTIALPSETCTVGELLDSVRRFLPGLDWEIRPGWWALAPSSADYLRYWAVYDTTALYRAAMARAREDSEAYRWPWAIDEGIERHLDLLLHAGRPPDLPPEWDVMPGRLILRATTIEHERVREWLVSAPGDPLILDRLAGNERDEAGAGEQ